MCSTRRNRFPTWDLRPYVNAIRKVAAGVSDVRPLTDLDNPGILNGRAVESFDAGTECRLRGGAFEVIAIAVGCRLEVTLVFRIWTLAKRGEKQS